MNNRGYEMSNYNTPRCLTLSDSDNNFDYNYKIRLKSFVIEHIPDQRFYLTCNIIIKVQRTAYKPYNWVFRKILINDFLKR